MLITGVNMDQLCYDLKPLREEDPSHHESLKFCSPADGTTQVVEVYSPAADASNQLPLIIAPHPMTWTAAQDYCEGLPDLKRGYHRGYYKLADKYKLILAFPHGHHRKVENASLAYGYQIIDLAYLPSLLAARGFKIDLRRIYACGLSMGGQEALVLAGSYPDQLAAVAAFNPIVDLAKWHDDLQRSEIPEIINYGTVDRIEEEVGGTPSSVPELYTLRSAMNYVRNIARVPTVIFWSERDAVIPGQSSQHSYQLYQRVKEFNPYSPIVEYNHTSIHGITVWSSEVDWMLHEWCDYEWAIQWLLQHTRRETMG